MFPTSLRWRLPLTYAGLALLTVVLLNALLLSTLLVYYQRLEQAYLLQSGLRSSADLATLLAAGADTPTLATQLQHLAQQYDVRLRLRDHTGQAVIDTGPVFGPLGTLGEGPALGRADAFFLEAAYGFNAFRRTAAAAEVTLTVPSSPVPLGWLSVSEGPSYGQDIVESVGWVGAAASLVAVGVAAGAGWVVSQRIVKPLAALTATSRRMAYGDLSARAPANRTDELGVLARSFNDMAGQVQGTVQTLRRFIEDAAHELHTPMTALATDLELAATEADPIQQQAYLARARTQTDRLAELSRDLLDLSRLEADQASPTEAVDLSALLAELSESYASRAEQAGLDFALEVPPGLTVTGHGGQLRQAVGNVLDNALKFTPTGGAVTLSAKLEGAWITVTVRDTGIGIPPEDLPRLLARFNRGRNAAGYPGSGLGLAIVRAILHQQGGEVQVTSAPGATTVTLRLRKLL